MDINIEQYNAVIDGLRTQLELQRALTQEKKQEISCLRILRDGDREKFTKMLSEHGAAVKIYLEVQKENDVTFLAIKQAHDAAMIEVSRLWELLRNARNSHRRALRH